MRAIYHRIDGIFEWKRGCMHGQQNIDQRCFPARRPSCLFATVRRRDEFLTETERKENKNTQNILRDICYLLFEEYPQERPCVYILKLCRKIGQSLEEISLRGGKLVNNFIIFWMNNIPIIEFGFRMMWRIVLCRSRRMLSTSAFSLGG